MPGITSVIGGIFCWLLRGNILASTAVNYVMTPFLFMCLVPFIRAGEWLFGVAEPVPFSLEPFSESLLGAIKLYRFESCFAFAGGCV